MPKNAAPSKAPHYICRTSNKRAGSSFSLGLVANGALLLFLRNFARDSRGVPDPPLGSMISTATYEMCVCVRSTATSYVQHTKKLKKITKHLELNLLKATTTTQLLTRVHAHQNLNIMRWPSFSLAIGISDLQLPSSSSIDRAAVDPCVAHVSDRGSSTTCWAELRTTQAPVFRSGRAVPAGAINSSSKSLMSYNGLQVPR